MPSSVRARPRLAGAVTLLSTYILSRPATHRGQTPGRGRFGRRASQMESSPPVYGRRSNQP